MNMLGLHVTLEDAELQFNNGSMQFYREVFDPKYFKITTSTPDYKKCKPFYDAAEVLESPNTGYDEPTAAVCPGFCWRVQIVAHAYPNMCHGQHVDLINDEGYGQDYLYCDTSLQECAPFSDAEGKY